MWMMSGIGTVVCLRLLLDERREPSAGEVGTGGSKGKNKKKVVGSGVLREDELLSQLAITIDNLQHALQCLEGLSW